MKKIFIISSIIFLAIALYLLFTPKAVSFNKSQQVTTPPAISDFVNESAREAQNPQQGLSEKPPRKEIAKPDPLPTICQGSESTNFVCYQKYYAALVKSSGVKAAFADLRARYAKDSYVVSQCHPLTHAIGNTAVQIYPTVSEAYTQGDSFCWSGYYHGVLEILVFNMGKDKIISEINTICADIPGKSTYSFDYYNCVHGIGHGIMAFTETELFQSLEICDNLNGSWEKSSCYSGVFMENIIVDNKNHFTKYLKPEEPLYPCTAVGEKYKQVCYLMQTSYMLKVSSLDFQKVFSLCQKADAGFVDTCYQSLGRDASGNSSSNAAKTKAVCDLGKDITQQSHCIIGAVKDFVSYYHSDKEAKDFCNLYSGELQTTCLNIAAAYFSTL